MPLIGSSNDSANWNAALTIWDRVVNWLHYETFDHQLTIEINSLLMYLWNEKDWLCSQHPAQKQAIESFVDNSKYFKIVADLANTVKHRALTKKVRSNAKDTNYFGKLSINNGASRTLHFISVDGTNHIEIMEILSGALDEIEQLHDLLASSST